MKTPFINLRHLRTTVLHTVHGSHLYGLNHAGSDLDTYQVFISDDKRQLEQQIDGDDDVTRIHLEQFLQQVERGVPQALEALFSPLAVHRPGWEAFFADLRPNYHKARATYRRTALNFAFHHGKRTGAALQRAKTTERIKLRRHALRLALNLHDLMTTGTFNPRLDPVTATIIKDMATADQASFEAIAHRAISNAHGDYGMLPDTVGL